MIVTLEMSERAFALLAGLNRSMVHRMLQKGDLNQLRTKSEPKVNQTLNASVLKISLEDSENEPRANQERTKGEPNKRKESENEEREETKDLFPRTPFIENKKEKEEKDKEKEKEFPLLPHPPRGVRRMPRQEGVKETKIDFEKVRQQFNRIMATKKIPKLKGRITGQRRAFFEARVREHGIIAVYRVMVKASESDFLNGCGRNGWSANFEWIYRPNNFPKVLDGYYDNPQEPPSVKAIKGGHIYDTTGTSTTGYRPVNRNEQRAVEQSERLRGYASVADKWRRIAEGGTPAVGD